tara:strand:+ start:426 stop:1361 length:936 start_codon:yes stop_codon:yes gene_type:complete
MALLTRKRLILIEEESTYGTDASPDGADAVLVRDLSIVPLQSDIVSRDLIRPYLGASEQLLANTRVECTFSVELAGSGTAGTAPRYGKALKACGFSETIVANTSVTYDPVSASFDSVTIHYNLDGVRHKVTGARGTFTITGDVGEIPSIDFTMTGIYVAPDDSAQPSVTYAAQASPLIFKKGNTTGLNVMGLTTAKLSNYSLEIGNEIVYRELVGGTGEVLLTNRNVTGNLTIEAVALSTKDYFATALADSLGIIEFTHGTTAGNIVKVDSARADIADVSYGDLDGIAMLEIPFTAIPSTTGNDEVELVYT